MRGDQSADRGMAVGAQDDGMNYYQFAAGVVRFGMPDAVRAAVLYQVPIECTLRYVRRFAKDGYVI